MDEARESSSHARQLELMDRQEKAAQSQFDREGKAKARDDQFADRQHRREKEKETLKLKGVQTKGAVDERKLKLQSKSTRFAGRADHKGKK
jgi:hypothetical protein